MLKYVLIVLACASGQLLQAQTVKLVKPLTGKDSIYLNQKLLSTVALGANISFSYENTDLYNSKKHDSPCSKKDIDSLAGLLKGNNSDAGIYLGMGGFYKRLHKPYEADTCFKKALALQKSVILANPDSSSAYNLQAMIYMSMGDFQNAKIMVRSCLRLNPLDTTVINILPTLHIMAGEIDSAKMVLNERIKMHGDSLYSYDFLPLCDVYGFLLRFSQANELGQEVFMNYWKQHPIIDVSQIEPYYRQDSTDVHKSLLYHVAKYLDTEMRIICVNARDTASSKAEEFKAILSKRDHQELAGAERYFKSCLSDQKVKNKYYPYKVLGNIYFIRGDYKKAADYTKKAIECKPLSKSRLQVNADEDYHNLYSIYCLAKDTVSAANLALEMIRIKPGIDSVAEDLVYAARASLYRKDYAKAKSLYLTAISFGDQEVNTYLGMAVTCYLLRDNEKTAYYLDKAFNADNTYSMLYAAAGIILIKENKPGDGDYMLKKSLELDKSKSNEWIKKDILKKYISIQ